MSEDPLSSLPEKFSGVTIRSSLDCPAFNVPAADLLTVCRYLRDDLGFDLLVDISGVDWEKGETRFSVVYHLMSTTRHCYVRLSADCPDNDRPKVPSLVSLWPAANWHEREAFDMFGIRFSEHPDMRRILMWDEYPYFPLRKDFPLAGIETDFSDPEVGELTGATTTAAPMMGGPFTAPTGKHVSENEPRAKDQSWTEKNPKPGDQS